MSEAVLCSVLNRTLWAGGWMTWVIFQFFQTSTTGDYQPTCSREDRTKTSRPMMHVAVKASSQVLQALSKSCIDHSGGKAQDREYFDGMEVFCFQYG